MDTATKEAMQDALEAIASIIGRSEKAQAKFAMGTAQHTLQENRIHALRIASALIENEIAEGISTIPFTKEALKRADAPLASLISKSGKAQQKLAPGTWQHAMLERNLRALRIASSLLEKAHQKTLPD